MSEIKVNKISPRTNCGTVTLGDSGDSFVVPAGATITNNGTQTGFGRTGTVDWQTGSIKTGDFTAVNTQGFFVDTNGGAVTATLPAGSAGAIISFQDYRNTFNTHNLTITPNGSEKINSGAGPVRLTTNGEGVTLVYIDSTVGWRSIQDNVFADVGSTFISATGGTVTCSGNCRIHTFTGPGTFTVSSLAISSPANTVGYLVVGGGGGGGPSYGGGGGAGGYRESPGAATGCYSVSPLGAAPATAITVTATSFPITVGGGGSGKAPGTSAWGEKGTVSTFSTISSAGGGGGGGSNLGGCAPTYQNGGSAGGGSNKGGVPSPGAGPGGTGNSPPTNPPQGNPGGPGGYDSPWYGGGGGGGATATGGSGGPNSVGSGGAGATSSINGTPTARSGGGGGGTYSSGNVGSGGTGGGGAGGGVNGTDNTGGGGGGGKYGGGITASGNGGSGVVILRYKFQ